MGARPSPAFTIEPLQDRHDRAGFASGVAELDRYLHTQAGQDAKRSVAATFVLVEQGAIVLGYYTLSAYSIALGALSPDAIRKLPKYPVLPATLAGRLAIRQQWQGRKLGQFLLIDALRRSVENTRKIGSIGVVVEAHDDSAMRFYRHHEFTLVPGQTRKLFLAMATIRKLFVA